MIQAQAESAEDAQTKVYQELEKMDQTNIFYRRDIGKNSI
ncbi:hypothetical protein NB814_09690 [Latilactobacillus curvatus]|nr:hypothetical protein [Latilactobacillus curvatus]MCM0725965.1 hypothetical protein [Latilactobacillus curvatus]